MPPALLLLLGALLALLPAPLPALPAASIPQLATVTDQSPLTTPRSYELNVSVAEERESLVPSNNNFSLSSDIHRQKSEVQVAPISLVQRAKEDVIEVAHTPILGRPTSSFNEQNLPVLDKLRDPPFDEYNNGTNEIDSDTLEPHYDDVEYDFADVKPTSKRGIESREWTDDVWEASYTTAVQSWAAAAGEGGGGGWLNETGMDSLRPGEGGSSETRQLAASLRALLAGEQAQRGRDLDLVLSGERALVQLWPQFGDLLERLLYLASDTCKSIPLVPLVSQYQGTETDELKMLVFTARGARELRRGERPPRARGPGRRLLVYVPGWWNTPGDLAARALRAALVPAAGALLVLDTRAAFCRPYLAAAARVPRVAEQLARWALRCGLPPARLHLLGFSLGAHAVAQAALRLRAAAGRRVGRLSALEPAAPCLRAGGWRRGARHVQVLHTSRALALRRPLGHADLYAAVPCAPACQHAAAWRLFAASARDPAALRAPRCAGPAELAAGACRGRSTTLGFHCAPDARGVYLLHPPLYNLTSR